MRHGLLAFFLGLELIVASAWGVEPSADLGSEGAYVKSLDLSAEGRLAEAVVALNEFLREMPGHAGGWLDLAVFSCELGRFSEKEQALGRLNALVGDAGIPDVLQPVVASLKESACKAGQSPGALMRYARATAGYTDNANLAAARRDFTLADNRVLSLQRNLLPKASEFAALEAGVVLPAPSVFPEGKASLSFGAGQIAYPRAPGFEASEVRIGYLNEASHRWARHSRYVVTLEQLWLGGQAYLAALSLKGAWLNNLGSGEIDEERTIGALFMGPVLQVTKTRYRLADFNAAIFEPGFDVKWQATPSVKASVGVGLIRDYRDGDRPGGDRRGRYMQVSLEAEMGERWQMEFSAKDSRLQDSQPYFPAFFGGARREIHALAYSLQVKRLIDSGQFVQFSVRKHRQDDAIPLFAYAVGAFSVNWYSQW